MRVSFLAGLIAGACGLAACSTDHKPDGSAGPAVADQPAAAPAHADQAPRAVVRGFLVWYQQHYDELGSIPIVPASVDEDSANVYAVDFTEAAQYVEELRVSHFIGEKYIQDEMTYMRQMDSVMRANPQTDGPPEGFHYDRIVFSQDPEADLAKLIRTPPIVTTKGDTARVLFPQLPKPEDLREGADLEFLLTRQQGKWVIKNIRPVFPD